MNAPRSVDATVLTIGHTAGAIYILRNPLDVAVSYSAHFGVSLDELITALSNDNVPLIDVVNEPQP